MENTPKIKLYATTWCYQSRSTRMFLDRHQVDYEYIDIDKDELGEAFVKETNHGYRSVPTLLFPDGTTLTEPSQAELLNKLGLEE
jgi:mycoredoxin